MLLKLKQQLAELRKSQEAEKVRKGQRRRLHSPINFTIAREEEEEHQHCQRTLQTSLRHCIAKDNPNCFSYSGKISNKKNFNVQGTKSAYHELHNIIMQDYYLLF